MTPGFSNPVLDSQACFRAVLDAMARPGTIHAVPGPEEPPAPLDRATAGVLLTLVDVDTGLWLDPAAAEAAGWIGFHCGAPAAALTTARFAVTLGAIGLAELDAGTDEAPEDGATLVIQVAAIGTGVSYRIAGPGLPGPATLRVDGLAADFVAQWAANRACFPRGVDVILCCGDRVAALPRTLLVEEG